jgi:hypothetical protein
MAHHVPDEPEVPEYVFYILEWFWQISSRRRSGMNGAESIGYADIACWRDLMQCDPTPQEIRVLLDMDDAFMAALAEEQREKREQDKQRDR